MLLVSKIALNKDWKPNKKTPIPKMKIELSHDLIAKKVYETASIKDKARAQAERLVKDRYIFSQNATDFHLSEQELKCVTPYVDEITLSQEESLFVKKSKKQLTKVVRTAKIKNYLIIGLACMVVFGSIAIFEHNRANEARELAQETTLYSQDLEDSIFFLQRDIKKMTANNTAAEVLEDNTIDLVSMPFSGKVINTKGKPIKNAEINLGGTKIQTNAQGKFETYLVVDRLLLGEKTYIQVSQKNYHLHRQKFIIDDKKEHKLEITLEKL